MEILISNEQDLSVDEEMLGKIAEYTIAHEGIGNDVELSIALVDEKEMQQLNLKYRGKNKPTDVLSFPTEEIAQEGEEIPGYVPEGFPHLLGDVVICPSVALKQAEEYGQTFEQEMGLLLVHGVLHLLGYDHQEEEEAEEMEAREREILKEFF